MSAAQRTDYQDAFTQHLATDCAQELAGYILALMSMQTMRLETKDGSLVAEVQLPANGEPDAIARSIHGQRANSFTNSPGHSSKVVPPRCFTSRA